MNATTLYVEACKCMLSFESENTVVWDQLLHLLPKLRQALSCRVCLELLIDPYGSHSCQHYVCKGCLRKKRSLTPGCRWCSNLDKLSEEKQIKIVLACYQKLCEYIAQTPVGGQRLSTQNGEYSKTLAILQEAITSPISLADFHRDQSEETRQVPVNESVSNSKVPDPASNLQFKMAPKSRDTTANQLPPEMNLLPKNKVAELLSPSPSGEGELKTKKRKRKHFKGTYYNYGKKKKCALRLTKSEPSLSFFQESEDSTSASSVVLLDPLDFKTEDHPQNEVEEIEEEENEEIQVVDDVASEEKPERVVITPPGKKRKYKGKLNIKRCKCGTSSKLRATRCISPRCPCYHDGGTCEHCPCLDCGNPFNNNNVKIMDDGCKLKFVDEKNVQTLKE